MKILYLSADLRNVGPTRQTLNIIKYSGVKDLCIVLTMFDEPHQTLLNAYLDAGVKVECLHLNRWTFVFNAVKKIVEFCKSNHIDVIHSNGVKPDIITYFAAKKANIKHVITLRNFPKEDLTGRMPSQIGKIVALLHLFALKRCKHLIACSKTIAKKMFDSYRVDITPIQNGVDTTLFSNRLDVSRVDFCEEFGITQGSKIFICTNSFISRKHNDEVAKSFVAANMDDAELLFLGDGPLLQEMQRQYSKCSKIHFMGKRADVSRFLQNSDVFVSASDSEGLPNAVLEALACGCFTLLSNIPQHQEILEVLPNCGKIFRLHDEMEMSNIMALTENLSASASMISSSLKESPFTMKKMGLLYGEYYRQLETLGE